MSNPNPSHKFKKGIPTNPKGRPKLTPELKAIKSLTADEFKKKVSKFLAMTRVEILDIIKDPQTSILDLYLGSVLTGGIKRGDYPTLDRLMDRLIGRVPVKLIGDEDNPIGIFISADLSKYPQLEKKKTDEK